MVKFSALLPEATVNYVTNPALRYDTTGWNAASATLTRVLTQARFGIASLRVVTAGTALHEGTFFRVSSLSGYSGPATASLYVRGAGQVRLRMIDNPAGKEWYTQPMTLVSDRWIRLSVSGTLTGSNDVRLYVETDEGTAKARTFYVDGAQLECKTYPTTYCDGDQTDCRWAGIYHASTSSRMASTRAGGRWYQLAGEEREQEDLYMTVVGGLGVAPITNNLQAFALEPGAFFSNNKISPRTIALTFHAKNVVDDQEQPVSLVNLHALRQTLIDVVKPDRTRGSQPIWFEYDDGNFPVYFQARYDGGLEGEWDIRNQFVNSFPVQLIAESPYVVEDNQTAASVDFQETIQVKHVLGRIDGAWRNLNAGFDDSVFALALGPRGQVYAAGDFSIANNDAAALSPTTPAVVAYWDGEKWVSIATTVSPAASDILSLAVAPNGDVYAGGTFTSINGVAANRIARWDGSTWNALGTGLSSQCTIIAVAPNGDVYAGGLFSSAGGVTCTNIARWDGLQWRRLGQFGGLNGGVSSLVIEPDGSILYAGGNFTREAGGVGVTVTNVAQYDIEAGTFSAMGDGLTPNSVLALARSPSGVIYAGGSFTASGSTSMLKIAQWVGGAWHAMSAGLDDTVYDVKVFSDGTLVAVGTFMNTGDVPVRKVALYNGSKWQPLDETLGVEASEILYACLINQDTDDLYIGGIFNNPGVYTPTQVSGFTTLDNTGSAEVGPKFYIKGPGKLRWLENQTSRKRTYWDLDILEDEEVFIDMGRGTVRSTVRGSLLYTLLPSSDFHAFTLLPGENLIAAFMTNDVGAELSCQFTPRHWSADATGRMDG